MQKNDASPRNSALEIIATLKEHGFIAMLAGGCVRDALLGQTPKDYDVATNATPNDVQGVFKRVRMVGKHFGVSLVRPQSHHDWIEVATFRTDGSYLDGRRPENVVFSTPENDAKRRDFTLNGMFSNPGATQDEIVDYVGGQDDIKHQLIRAIGVPAERFAEDYLRMLRAIRFASRLEFKIESITWQALTEHAHKITGIAKERSGEEIRKMLCHPSFYTAATRLENSGLATALLGKSPYSKKLQSLSALDPATAYPIKLLAWMYDSGRIAYLNTLKESLNLTNSENDVLLNGWQWVNQNCNDWENFNISNKKRALKPAFIPALLEWLKNTDNFCAFATLAAANYKQLSNDGIGINPPPFITGKSLISLGIQPTQNFSHWLDYIYNLQLDGTVQTEADAHDVILNYIAQHR